MTFALESVFGQPVQISLVGAENLEEDFTAEVDIVFVYEVSVLNQLPFEQFDWISSREQEKIRFGNRIDVISLQVVAGTKLENIPLPARVDMAMAVLVFASHADPVAEGIDITRESKLVLQVENWGIEVRLI
jgi:hypothetical protein